MRTVILAGLLLAISACDRNERTPAAVEEPSDPSVVRNTESARPATELSPGDTDDTARNEPTAADNTERNERDRDSNTLTPVDQGGSEADRKLTQEIRQRVMDQDGLSTNAKNVKIITNAGVVTLRGPVDSAEEKATIERLARGASGAQRVDNQLEIATP